MDFYYYEYNFYTGDDEYNSENIGEPKYQKKCLKQKRTESAALELTYSHLGRLIQSTEILYFKLNIIENSSSLKYQSYDYFKVEDKKDIDTIKYDIINVDFYEKEIKGYLHNKQYKYVQPKSIYTIINELIIWQNKVSHNDKSFFSNILSLILSGSYNESYFQVNNNYMKKQIKINQNIKKWWLLEDNICSNSTIFE